jgi:4-hydroxy-3-methylbut-2-enyl diphosphate reductase
MTVAKVLLAEPRGFCAGVEMAIKALTWMVRIFDGPVYCFHDIVHNKWVVGAFEDAGVTFVESIDDVPIGSPVMLSAHGSAPEVITAARDRAGITIDAVCPLVTKVHHEVKRMASKGYDIIYIGHEGHQEAIGTVAEAPDSITLVEPEDGLVNFTPKDPEKVALLAQTTLGVFEWENVKIQAEREYPALAVARRSDLCYATTNRQSAVKALAQDSDVVLVVGSTTSSNTQALVRVAREMGCEAHRIDDASQIDERWLEKAPVVGVTAGASAPDHLIEEVIDYLSPADGVQLVDFVDEDEYFPLPPQLRTMLSVLTNLVEAGFGRSGPRKDPVPDRDWSASEALGVLGS